MKLITLIFLLSTLIFCCAFSYKTTYYIYIDSKDVLVQKNLHTKGGSIYYLCSCCARNNALEFTFRDTSKSYIKDKLPSKTYSMLEFAQIANDIMGKFKNNELRFSEIYIVERISRYKYHYYKVQFYSIEGDE